MIGVVAIGRNEGQRLIACLRSILADNVDKSHVVYVDSGSTDGSVAVAKEMGVRVIELDSSQAFTAARGRNAGFDQLLREFSDLPFVQFIDGDCELKPGFLAAATATLTEQTKVAAVCGRRREKFPEASPYNRLCDIEWNTPIGEADACGGDALIRVEALKQVGGYGADLIAGEDPELCARLRKSGWKILRIDHEMTVHDAAMTRFGQWWRRMVRAGHAFAEVSARQGICRHESQSNWAWGLVLPIVALSFAWLTRGISIGVAILGYFFLWWRIRRTAERRGLPSADAALYARYGVLAKFPMVIGQLKYWLGGRGKLIEYKDG